MDEKIANALEIAARGRVDGAHHKSWVIDQIVRALTGSPEAYAAWVREAKAGVHGPDTYEWDEGIAP